MNHFQRQNYLQEFMRCYEDIRYMIPNFIEIPKKRNGLKGMG